MALTITVNGGGTFTASMEEGPVSFSASLAAVGPAGPGVAAGGTEGQILVKTSGQDYATGWIDNSARSSYITARNSTGTAIAKGKVVYLSGATGNKPTITLAQANAEVTSARTIGITKAEIANGADGDVIILGAIENIDTSAFAAGDSLYLSETTAGGLRVGLPTQPNHGVFIGIVTRSHPSLGSIEVAIQNYQELKELSDVLITSATNLDLLSWDTASSVWKNKSFSTLGLLTSASAASTYLTQASAAATYQTLAGMSSYLTTSAAASTYLTQTSAASTYYPLTGNPSGFLVSGDLAGYLTSATAAATYQTLSGMSAYLTTSAAASTYLTQANAASIYAPIASPTFTGTVTIPAGASISGFAPLASPALTGTPTAPTAAAATNTTQIATTAFVQQEVPAASTTAAGKVELATDAEVRTGTSSTLAVTPAGFTASAHARKPNDHDLGAFTWLTATSGANQAALRTRELFTVSQVSATATGYSVHYIEGQLYNRGASVVVGSAGIDWSKRVVFTARAARFNTSPSTNCIARIIVGKINNSGVAGDPAVRAIGIKIDGSGAIQLMAHDGTSLSTVTSSYTPTNETYDIEISSDGSGNVALKVNGSEVATTTGGPTNAGVARLNGIHFEVENTATVTTGQQFYVVNPKISILD